MASDEEGIRRTLAEFCRALDDRRFEDWSATFTEDGVFDSVARRCVGRPAILARILETELNTMPELRRKHTVHNLVYDIDGNEASGSCDLIQVDKFGDQKYEMVNGQYIDRLAKQPDGRWLFTYRHVSAWRTPASETPKKTSTDKGMSNTDDGKIRRTLAEYCSLLDSRRFEDWSKVFSEDAVFRTDTPAHESVGRKAIYEEILAGKLALNPELRRQHTSHNVVIRVDGDSANVTSDFLQVDKLGDEPIEIRVGKYVDHMVRENDRWLIKDRAVSTWPMRELA